MQNPGFERRQQLRYPLKLRAQLRVGHAAKFTVIADDISENGITVQFHDQLHLDDLVRFAVPGYLALEATVVWARDHHIGCRFTHPLAGDVLHHIVRLSEGLP